MDKQGTKQCYLCNTSGANTADHCPPKGFFPDPKPNNLVTLLACSACNSSFSKDEEYVRNYFSLLVAPTYDADVQPLYEKFRRGYRKEPSKLREVMGRMEEKIHLFSPGGRFLGETAPVRIPVRRLRRVYEKIARGLAHYHRAPSETPVRFGFYSVSAANEKERIPPTELMSLLPYAQHRFRWGSTFEYSGLIYENMASLWWMSFYQAHLGFISFGIDVPENEIT
jgi:hypothetical protein